METFEDVSVFVAGHVAPPGDYRRIDVANGKTIVLDRSGVLPASFDGTVALYQRIESRLPIAPRHGGPRRPRRREVD